MAGELGLASHRDHAPPARRTTRKTEAMAAIQSRSATGETPLESWNRGRLCGLLWGRHPNGQNALVKQIVARRAAPVSARADAQRPSSTLALLETRRSGRPRDLVAPGPDAEQLAESSRSRRARPTMASSIPGASSMSRADRRDAFAELLERAYRIDNPEPGRLEIEAERALRPSGARAGRRPLQPDRGPQDPGLGAGALLRRRLHEPVLAAHALGFAGRLGDRLGGLFAERCSPPSARRTSGSPASSSSARPARSWRSGCARSRRVVSEWAPPANAIKSA